MMKNEPEPTLHIAVVEGINRIWEKILHCGNPMTCPRGLYIYPYQDHEDSFYYLKKGKLTILHDAPNGKTRNMLYMQPGTLINVAHTLGRTMTSFLDAGCRFHCLTNVEMWRFEGSLLRDEKFIADFPELIINLMESLGVKLLLMHNTLSQAGTGDAVTKLSRFCLNLSQAHNDKVDFSPEISLGDLANLLGLHRASLFRAIKKLQEEGLIGELTRKRLLILNLDGLRKKILE